MEYWVFFIIIYGEVVKIDPKALDPNTEVIRFYPISPIFKHSIIPWGQHNPTVIKKPMITMDCTNSETSI